MSNNLAIKINKLFKSYDDVKAVQGIDLEINKGEFYGLLGPNGAGKSTTINSITSLVKPSDGDIEIFGKNIENDFRFARSQVGIARRKADWFFPLNNYYIFRLVFMEYQDLMQKKELNIYWKNWVYLSIEQKNARAFRRNEAKVTNS